MLALLAAGSAFAENMIYRGVFTYRTTGSGSELRQVIKGFVVLDSNTGEAWRINYGSAGQGVKFYSVESLGTMLYSKVTGRSDDTNTVATLAGTDASTPAATRVVARSAHGKDDRMEFNAGETFYFPRRMSWTAFTVRPSGVTTGSEFVEETGNTSLEGDSTKKGAVNQETMAQTIQRITSDLFAKGYREIEFK
jgi:hypothetical protein